MKEISKNSSAKKKIFYQEEYNFYFFLAKTVIFRYNYPVKILEVEIYEL